MKLTYLLDINIVCEPLRPVPNDKILKRLEVHADEIAIASVVWHELWVGCSRLPVSARRAAIERYLIEVMNPAIPILPYDQRVAERHAAERARLAALGRMPPFADGQIAATAIANNLVLVTLNQNDFAVFQGLQLEDWSR